MKARSATIRKAASVKKPVNLTLLNLLGDLSSARRGHGDKCAVAIFAVQHCEGLVTEKEAEDTFAAAAARRPLRGKRCSADRLIVVIGHFNLLLALFNILLTGGILFLRYDRWPLSVLFHLPA
jgi:hypothetical protein